MAHPSQMGCAAPDGGAEGLDDSAQLPTPRETPKPESLPSGLLPLDTLFTTDITMDANDTQSS